MFHSLKRFKNVVFHAEKSKPTWKLIRNALFLVQKRRFFEGLKKDLEKIQLLENKANSPKGNLLFALLFSSNKGLYA